MCTRSHDSDYRLAEYVRHLANLASLILWIILDYAEGINPNKVDAKRFCYFNGIF
jgi:hypothetical protein